MQKFSLPTVVDNSALASAVTEAAKSPDNLILFLGRYTAWNAIFGPCVASLSGRIGLTEGVFVDDTQPNKELADRSVFVASRFFSAAVEEFDYQVTPAVDTHRCLAQAMMTGLLEWHAANADTIIHRRLISMLGENKRWLREVIKNTKVAYTIGTTTHPLFYSMGFHAASEALAHHEFTILFESLKEKFTPLYIFLASKKFPGGEGEFHGHHWLRIHAGTGGAAELDHYHHAVEGVDNALKYAVRDNKGMTLGSLQSAVLAGFQGFIDLQRAFLENVFNSDAK